MFLLNYNESFSLKSPYASTDSLKMVTFAATSYLEKLSHEKTFFETKLFPCISYKYWNRIDGDQDMFQPFLFAEAYTLGSSSSDSVSCVSFLIFCPSLNIFCTVIMFRLTKSSGY